MFLIFVFWEQVLHSDEER
jgi:hypothetical protein